MNGLQWYRREPEAFLQGVERMSLEEVGAYTLLLDHMYMRGGPLRDSATFLAGLLGVDVRVWNRIRASLIRRGKIVESDGMLTNRRVEAELEAQAELRSKRSKAGRISGHSRRREEQHEQRYRFASSELADRSALVNAELSGSDDAKPLKTKETDRTRVEHVPEHNRTERDIEYIPPIVPQGGQSPDAGASGPDPVPIDRDVTEAIRLFSEAASACGWVRPQRLTAARRGAIRKRLREDGLDGWEKAISEAKQMPFLGGDNNRGWRMDIDYFARPSGWTKIIEGAFSKRPAAQVHSLEPPNWALRYSCFDTKNLWRDTWGPRPGEPGHEGPRAARPTAAQPMGGLP